MVAEQKKKKQVLSRGTVGVNQRQEQSMNKKLKSY